MQDKMMILLLISIFLYSIYVKFFKRVKQYERAEGLKSHQQKNGTITMGGIIFVVLPLFFIWYDPKTFNISLTMLMYGILGFMDDLLIIIRHNNKGIPPTLKLILQIVIAAVSFIFYLNSDLPTILDFKWFQIEIKWIYGLFLLGILAASTNAFNLTDGVDGLCSGLSILLSIAFILIAIEKREYSIAYMVLCVTIVLFVFWCFNLPKAFLFMGDTGSLALGAFYAMLALYLNSLIGFILMASIFIFETLSVMIQVAYYKRTNGKRIFKMAPFHHHLESCGWNELQIDILFYLIEIIFILLVFFLRLY